MVLGYVGYVNELLKGSIADFHRAALLVGFIIGAAAASKYLSLTAMKSYRKLAQERRR